jgi:hypothetical protein
LQAIKAGCDSSGFIANVACLIRKLVRATYVSIIYPNYGGNASKKGLFANSVYNLILVNIFGPRHQATVQLGQRIEGFISSVFIAGIPRVHGSHIIYCLKLGKFKPGDVFSAKPVKMFQRNMLIHVNRLKGSNHRLFAIAISRFSESAHCKYLSSPISILSHHPTKNQEGTRVSEPFIQPGCSGVLGRRASGHGRLALHEIMLGG